RCGWAKAAPSPSWRCSARSSRRRSSSSPACSARTPTRTGRTSSCTSITRSGSPPASPTCLRRTRRAEKPPPEKDRQHRQAERRHSEYRRDAYRVGEIRGEPYAARLSHEEKRGEERDGGAACARRDLRQPGL